MIDFFVPGIPKPGGSKKAFKHPYTNRVMIVDASNNKDWMNAVKDFCQQAYDGLPIHQPVRLDVTFFMPRPKYHFGTGKNAGKLKDNAPVYHTVKPDRTKLLRSTEDALTGIAWRDDTQVVTGNIEKRYGDRPGAKIRIDIIR